MNLLQKVLSRPRGYRYWEKRLGTTVVVSHGAFQGRWGRLTNLCSHTYGLVAFEGIHRPVCIQYKDLQQLFPQP